MKRLLCLLLLLPLTGCAAFDDLTAFGNAEPGSTCAWPAPVNACGVVQTSASLPAQTTEPPR
jgi:hypothetical protein